MTGLCRSRNSRYADSLLGQRTFDSERHLAVNQSKQGMVLADTDIGAGVKPGAALANNDAACIDDFAAKFFDAEHFGL